MNKLYEIKFKTFGEEEYVEFVVCHDISDLFENKDGVYKGRKIVGMKVTELASNLTGSVLPPLEIVGLNFEFMEETLKETIGFMESCSDEAWLQEHELDCDGESCILCDARKLYKDILNYKPKE